ncbi:MAG TPA: RNA polymerase sigma-70 factor [Sphingobacteriaceae bacterium]
MADYSGFSDRDLANLLKAGDITAFNEIYNRFSKVLYIYARKIVGNKDDAEDLVQDIFVTLWNKSETLELRSSLSSYLYASVRYKFFDLISSRKIRSDYISKFQLLIDTGVCSTDDYIDEKELSFLVEKEINGLPHKMREVFELSRKAGLSHREIAEKLDLSEKTVRNHINHALKILRLKLGMTAFLLFFLS